MEVDNRTVYYQIVTRYLDRPMNRYGLERLTVRPGGDHRPDRRGTRQAGRCGLARRTRADLAEFRTNAALAIACRLGIAAIRAGRVGTSALPSSARAALAAG